MWPFRAVFVILASSCILAAKLQDFFQVTVTEGDAADNDFAPVPAGDGIIIGDIRISPHRNAVSNPRMKWPNGRVPYVISAQYTSSIRNTMLAAMREIEQDVNGAADNCVKFIPRTNELSYIEIVNGTGCNAEIGMLGAGKQDVSIGRGCEFKGIIMHELLHVLGFWHEHSRYDRDTYININLTNIRDNQLADFNMAPAGTLDTLNTPYDFSSIMHYGPYTLAKDKTIPVITPKPGQAAGIKLGQRLALSNWDVIRIQRRYSCTEDTSHIRRTYLTDNIARCDFANDMCNFTDDTTSSLHWTVMRGGRPAGPLAGSTNGADAYLVATEQGQNGTARILTPFFRARTVCVSFVRFQRGQSSYLNVVGVGPRIPRTVLATYQGKHTNGWTPARIGLNAPANSDFQIVFEANISSGDVAIDDVNIYNGACF